MLPIPNVILTKCNLYAKCYLYKVYYTKCYQDQMLLYENVLCKMLLIPETKDFLKLRKKSKFE